MFDATEIVNDSHPNLDIDLKLSWALHHLYDEKRNYGIYYDLVTVHQVQMSVQMVDHYIELGHSQAFSLELDDEVLYDQLWEDYFHSVNIQARKNLKLHIQFSMCQNAIGVI